MNKNIYFYTTLTLTVIIFSFVFFLSEGKFGSESVKNFFSGLSIEFLGGLVTALVIYLFATFDRSLIKKSISIEDMDDIVKQIVKTKSDNLIVKPNYREHNWDNIIQNSKNIEICAYYFDSWITANWESLILFFNKGGKLKIVMTKTDVVSEQDHILRIFPKFNNITELENRVKETKERLLDLIESSTKNYTQIEIYYLKKSLSYPLIIIDRKVIILSVFSNFNDKKRVETPSLYIENNSNNELIAYWNEEYKILCDNSVKEKISSEMN